VNDHRQDHVVAKPDGSTRIATEAELRALYAGGWTMLTLARRHDLAHEATDEGETNG
jgi:hypothetical protein